MANLNKYPAVVIPAYQPTPDLLNLVKELRQGCPEHPIIVVNDGSDPHLIEIFNELLLFKVDLIHHPKNYGKGQALKTAFKHYLNTSGEQGIGVVTADADGQHAVEDIVALTEALIQTPAHLHLGVRDFAKKEIPWRSKFGNRLTNYIFQSISNAAINDTQTGLRGIPNVLLGAMISSNYKGYELELEMLLRAAQQKIHINQIPIKTIYLNQNADSHFNPIFDSIKVYRVLFRYMMKGSQ